MVIPGDPLAYQEGNVGWAIDRTVRFCIGDQEAPFRFSVVYRHEDGEWKLVHFHSSVGASNEGARGVTLPDYPRLSQMVGCQQHLPMYHHAEGIPL